MKNFALAATILLFAAGSAMAQDTSCAAKAVGRDGKPLDMVPNTRPSLWGGLVGAAGQADATASSCL